jgi:hypothetical protein
VISPNGLLSSLWVWQHKDESNPFLFATENSPHHVLFEQRQRLKELFDQAEGKERPEKKGIFKQIKRELESHTRIEEGIFYPAIEHYEHLKDRVLESYRKHKEVKLLLGEIESLVSQSKPFESKLKILQEMVEHRDEEEESEIFPQVRKLMDDETLEKLARQFETARGKRSKLLDAL